MLLATFVPHSSLFLVHSQSESGPKLQAMRVCLSSDHTYEPAVVQVQSRWKTRISERMKAHTWPTRMSTRTPKTTYYVTFRSVSGGRSGITAFIAFMSPKLWFRRITPPFAPKLLFPKAEGVALPLRPTSVLSVAISAFTAARARSCSLSHSSTGRVHVHSLPEVPVRLPLHALSLVRYIWDVDEDGTGDSRPFHAYVLA